MDVNANGKVDSDEMVPVESQPVGFDCSVLCKQEKPGNEDETKVNDFSLEVTTFANFNEQDKAIYESYCGVGNTNCVKIKIVPKVGVLADFYGDVIKLKFNGGLKSMYPNAVQFKNTDQFFFSYDSACKQGTSCTYDISLTVNDVLQNLANNKGEIKCYSTGGEDKGGDEYTGSTPKEKLVSYYVDYIGFDNTGDSSSAYELPVNLGVKNIDYLSSKSLDTFDKMYLLISQDNFNSLLKNGYTLDLYSSFNSNLYTRLIRLLNMSVSNISSVQKDGKLYYQYTMTDD